MIYCCRCKSQVIQIWSRKYIFTVCMYFPLYQFWVYISLSTFADRPASYLSSWHCRVSSCRHHFARCVRFSCVGLNNNSDTFLCAPILFLFYVHLLYFLKLHFYVTYFISWRHFIFLYTYFISWRHYFYVHLLYFLTTLYITHLQLTRS